MNHKKRRAAIAASAMLVLVAFVCIYNKAGTDTAYTEGAYDVTGLDMRVSVSKDHIYEVEEFISVDIPDDLPGIEFAVPGESFRVKDLTLEGKKTGAVRRAAGHYVAIKDPELLTAGHHRYRITYRLPERADRNKGKDVFSFPVLPEGWTQPVYKVHALMWFPYGFPLDEIRYCAEESQVSRITVKIEPQSRSYTIGARGVPGDYRLRLEADLPEGYWE